jgi:hypothetical protein
LQKPFLNATAAGLSWPPVYLVAYPVVFIWYAVIYYYALDLAVAAVLVAAVLLPFLLIGVLVNWSMSGGFVSWLRELDSRSKDRIYLVAYLVLLICCAFIFYYALDPVVAAVLVAAMVLPLLLIGVLANWSMSGFASLLRELDSRSTDKTRADG